MIAMAARVQLSASIKGPKFPWSCLGLLSMLFAQIEERLEAMAKHNIVCLQRLSPHKDEH